MSISNFITSVWSETLYNSLEKEYVGVKNCTREFEGDLQGAGSIKVCSIRSVDLFPYVKNTSLEDPQVLDDNSIRISATRARAFNFQIDDIDLAQSNPVIMKSAMQQAARALANDADAYVFGLHTQVDPDEAITNANLTPNNVIDTIISARERMLKNNINSNTKTVLEVSPEIASIILKANIAQLSNNQDALFNGYVGSFIGFDIYVSNNIVRGEDGYFKCFARTKNAIAFAEQIKSIEAYRPNNRFADAVKGLYFYGAQVIDSTQIFLLNLQPGI